MKLVIEITEEYYKTLHNIPDAISTADMLLIKYGTPLPEHHGRLIEDKLIADEYVCGKADPYYIATSEWLKLQPTIIPATKEGAE